MRPDDVRWPAAREAARRLLRTPHVALEVNENDLDTARHLVASISDTNPARLHLPHIIASEVPCIRDMDEGIPVVAWGHSDDLRTLSFLIEGAEGVSFADVAAMAHSLLDAGYPGCLGCGGPGLEAPWDEEAWRTRQVTTSFK